MTIKEKRRRQELTEYIEAERSFIKLYKSKIEKQIVNIRDAKEIIQECKEAIEESKDLIKRMIESRGRKR